MIQLPTTIDDQVLLHIDQVSKAYVGVKALQNVSLILKRGEVHALCGENGAGKSTLIKILTGVVTPDSGRLEFNGHELTTGDVRASELAGIAVMHQESTAFPDLNAVDNIFVGREIRQLGGAMLNRRQMRQETAQLLEQLGESIDLTVPVGQLRLAQRQMVAMARAMSCQCQLFVMDEPTASLSAQETEAMLRLITQLRDRGVTIMYVSHRLEEVYRIADRVTVLRDGQHVATQLIADLEEPQLICAMVGREAEELTRRHDRQTRSPNLSTGNTKVVLKVNDLSRRTAFQSVSFSVSAGEIVGLAGLVGAGRTELARAIFGIDTPDSGSVEIAGQRLTPGSIGRSMGLGLAMVPEDRQHEGLVLPLSIAANLSLACLTRLPQLGFIVPSNELRLVEQQVTNLGIKTPSLGSPAESLSGGNQQKVVLGKWLATKPKMLILDEPTRGVDVAAKAQVHRIIRSLAAEGMATLLISSELTEVLSMSDRILVMHQGRLAAEYDGRTATREQLLHSALLGSASFGSNHLAAKPCKLNSHLRSRTMERIPRSIVNLLRQREFGLLLFIIAVALLVGAFDIGFWAAGNLRDISVRGAPTAIVACGVMLVVVTAEIDISVGSLMALTAAAMGIMISDQRWNLSMWVGIPATLLLGTCVGLTTGLLVTVGRVPSIIVTLGLLTALRGLTTLMMGGENIDGLPDPLTRLTKQGVLGLPLSVWVAGCVIAVTGVIVTWTPLGRRIFALGSSRYAAHMMGLSERRLKLFVFAYTGFLTALATIVDVPRLPKIESGIGMEFELLVVTCVVVGGVSISGGRGTLRGVMLAVILMTMIRPVLTFMEIGEEGEKWTKAIQGSFIAVAVIGDSLLRRSTAETLE